MKKKQDYYLFNEETGETVRVNRKTYKHSSRGAALPKDYVVFKDIHSTITFEDGRKENVIINGKMKLDFQSQNLNAPLNPKP